MSSGPASSQSPFREGDLVAGKYRVERVLGAGGMGVVVAAFHEQLRQRVAIKVLLPEVAGGVDSVARFAREAQAAARIQSEHVARVIDVATLADGSPYMVMEFLEGQDLGQLLAARGPLPLEEAVGYVLEACEGVAEAHAAGIVHRDLKPANLFLCQRGGGRTILKVLDFGISKANAGVSDIALTRTGAVMGSPLYMSPEQMRSAKYVDARTDVWSLGVTLFELLCGKTPFRGDSMTELVAAVLQAEPLALRDVRADLPPELTPVLGRALEKDPARRYRTVGELASALAAFGPSHSELTVERIARALGSMAPGASGAPSAPPVHGSRLRPEAEQLAHEATAEAVSVPVVRGAGSTTAQPVSNEGGRVATPPARSRGSAFWIVVAGVVVAAGGAAAMKLRGNGPGPGVVAEPSASPSTAPPSPPSAPPSAAASVEGRPSTPVAPVESPAPAASAQVPRKATAPAHPAAVNVAPPRPAAAAAQPAPASSPACRVVQYLDADGETRFRRECP